jgi:plastocyanin
MRRGARLALASAIGGALLAPGALLAAGEQTAASPPPPAASAPVGAPAAAADDSAAPPRTATGSSNAQVTDAEPPRAALSVTPQQPVAGRPLQLDAGGSSGPVARYRWDLDGDGSFETDAGARVERTLPAGAHRLAVRVEDAAGRGDEAAADVTVAEPPKPEPQPHPAAQPGAAAQPVPAAQAQQQPAPAQLPRATKRVKPAARPAVHAAAASSVTIKNFAFAPASVTVNTGDTVTWTNQDDAPHTATGSGGSFNTGTLAKGKSASHTFSSAGSFSYICAIHPNMHGTVVVKGASSGGSASGSGGGAAPSATPSSPSATASGTSGTSGTTAAGAGALPHTGLELLAVTVVGLLLTGSGVALRAALGGFRTRRRTT